MKRSLSQSRKTRTAAHFEPLENRQLMSVSPFVINGTAGNDVITVNYGTNLVVAQNPALQATHAATLIKTSASAAAAGKVVTTAKAGYGLAAVAKAPVATPIIAKAPVVKAPPVVVTPKAPIKVILPPTIFDNLTYTINGVLTTTYLSPGQSIQVNGLDGNDKITVNGKVNADIEGGAGNDSLTGGAGNDSINGGDGNDLIHAGTGTDVLHGNAGNDVIYTGTGSSYAYGDDGNDNLFAGTGHAVLDGGNGDDIMVSIGGNSSDLQLGDTGNNSFWLGAGQIALDPTAAEAKTNVHRVTSYQGLHVNGTYVGTPGLAMNIGNLPDPTIEGNYTYKSFAGVPLFNNSTPIEADVNQGSSEDCYFMAVIAGVAKNDPNAIKQSVVDLGDGTYVVDFKDNGADHFIRVDADLPVDKNGNPGNAHWISQPADLWAPLMEKAWAFYRHNAGTYASIDFGFPSEAFSALNISNSSYDPHNEGFLDLQSENATDFGNHICSLLAGGNTVTLCTPQDSMYLVGSHCYTVDHVNEVNGKVVSITLRNPWGHDGRGGDGVNDGFVTLTGLDVLESVDQVTWGKA